MSLHIPNTAPFSGAQKMWLKGYLDALNSALIPSSSGTPVATIPQGQPVTILWGSQTGNSESLGKKLAKKLTANGHLPTLRDMAGISPAELGAMENLLIITSTYGDGEPPDNAAALHAALHADEAPALSNVKFAVLALGDSNYAEFCKCGRDFHTRLSALGAQPMLPLVESDVDFDGPFATWISQLENALAVA
jgi:sulfite reductase (NADPH) flavoprotein alpha-component